MLSGPSQLWDLATLPWYLGYGTVLSEQQPSHLCRSSRRQVHYWGTQLGGCWPSSPPCYQLSGDFRWAASGLLVLLSDCWAAHFLFGLGSLRLWAELRPLECGSFGLWLCLTAARDLKLYFHLKCRSMVVWDAQILLYEHILYICIFPALGLRFGSRSGLL